jgi:hypothetical protein
MRYHHAKAYATCKKHAKQLYLQQRDFNAVVKDLRCTSKRHTKSTEVVIGNQVAMIHHLQTKVASAELSVEFIQRQLDKEHKDAMSDLMVANRSKIPDLKYDHVTYLAEEKKKLRLQLITEHQRQNSL